MKLKSFIIFYQALILFSITGYGQCQPDSIISYRIVNNSPTIASIEYFQYDTKDSLIKTWLTNFDDEEKPKPSYQINISRSKTKGSLLIQFESDLWNDARAIYTSSSREIHTRNKKGQLLNTEILNYSSVNGASDFVKANRTEYSYNKVGKIVDERTLIWDINSAVWLNTTKKTVKYNEFNMEQETQIYAWLPEKQIWVEDWKHVFEYDSVNILSKRTTYQSVANAWVPFSKTDYGVEELSPIKWNRVQVWDGEKRLWKNQFQYVFQFDDQENITTEVHLSWAKDEWKIDFAVFYIYNESGDLIKILNDSQQIIWVRFCAQN